jgi:glycerol-3-phosphate acyltransferase PlsY
MFLALALVVLWRHRENIVRLIDGSEPRIGKGG